MPRQTEGSGSIASTSSGRPPTRSTPEKNANVVRGESANAWWSFRLRWWRSPSASCSRLMLPLARRILTMQALGRGDLGERRAQLHAIDDRVLEQNVPQVHERLARLHAKHPPTLYDDMHPLAVVVLELERPRERSLERVDEKMRDGPLRQQAAGDRLRKPRGIRLEHDSTPFREGGRRRRHHDSDAKCGSTPLKHQCTQRLTREPSGARRTRMYWLLSPPRAASQSSQGYARGFAGAEVERLRGPALL